MMSKKFPYKKKIKIFLTLEETKGRGCDQSYAAYLVYIIFFSNLKIYSNKLGHLPLYTILLI